MNKYLRYGLVFSLVLLITSIFLTLTEDALTRKSFIDELFSVESSSRFWLTGKYELAGLNPHQAINDGSLIGQWYQYTNGPFTSGQSIGVLANWLSGLMWNISGSLYAARLGSMLNIAILFYAISHQFRHFFKDSSKLERTVISLWIWMMTLLSVTYSIDGINHSLGEFSGALWIVLGLMVGIRNIYWGSFLLGMAVFHSKFIYFPYGLLGVFTLVFYRFKSKHFNFNKTLKVLFTTFLCFLAPQIIFLVWVTAFDGLGAAIDWTKGRISFIKYGNSGFDSNSNISGLINRLTHPDLEWVHFDFKVRLRFVLWTCIVPFLTLFAVLFKRRSKYILFAVYLSMVVLIFSAWFFFWHPTMWLRHFQPAVYGGWILGLGWFFYFIAKMSVHRRIATVCILSITISVWQLSKSQTLSALGLLSKLDESYAYRCQKLNLEPSNLWRNPSCIEER